MDYRNHVRRKPLWTKLAFYGFFLPAVGVLTVIYARNRASADAYTAGVMG